ncbi:uncharacterized protein LOC144688797 [Cetorhinus maximus]
MPRRQRVPALKQLSLSNMAANMKDVWAKDYVDNYLNEYHFLHIMGPFNDLALYNCSKTSLSLFTSPSAIKTYVLFACRSEDVRARMIVMECGMEMWEWVHGTSGEVSLSCMSIRCLCTFICTDPHVFPVLQGLTALDLHGCSRIQSSILVDLIGCLPRLRKLTLSSTQCNSQVLSVIGSTCRELRELDVSGCKEVTSLGLLRLMYHQTGAALNSLQLRKLLTEGIRLSPDNDAQHVTAMAFLLLALPRLEYVTHTFLAEALTLIHGQLFGKGQHFLRSQGFPSLQEVAGLRLASGVGAWQTALNLRRLDVVLGQDLPILTSTCREVAEATISLGDELRDLRHLHSWTQLTCLTVECSGFYRRTLSDMIPVLSSLGPQLRLLSLQNFHYHLETSLSHILGFCPHLRVFQAQIHLPPQNGDSPPVEEDSDDDDDDQLQDKNRLFGTNWQLLQLKDFSLRILDSSPLTRSFQLSIRATLVRALQGSPELSKLSLINVPVPLDKVFRNVLEQPASLVQLSELCLAHSSVSSAAVHLLMAAHNQLASLDLRRCRDVHRRHYDQFVEDAKRSKFDLKISWE